MPVTHEAERLPCCVCGYPFDDPDMVAAFGGDTESPNFQPERMAHLGCYTGQDTKLDGLPFAILLFTIEQPADDDPLAQEARAFAWAMIEAVSSDQAIPETAMRSEYPRVLAILSEQRRRARLALA